MKSSQDNNWFCIIRNSGEIRKVINLRLKSLGVSLYQLCEDLDVDYSKFRYYLNTMQPEKGKSKMASQYDIIKVAKSLGVDIGVQVVIRSEDKVTAKPFDSSREYNKLKTD